MRATAAAAAAVSCGMVDSIPACVTLMPMSTYGCGWDSRSRPWLWSASSSENHLGGEEGERGGREDGLPQVMLEREQLSKPLR